MSQRRQRLPDYEDICRQMGVELCPGPPAKHCGVAEDNHRDGFVRAGNPPTIHWQLHSRYVPGKNRSVTRQGIYRVLKLIYRALNPEVLRLPRWERLYDESRAAVMTAERIGIRIGRDITEYDRVKVKFLLSDPKERDTQKKETAWKWAQKRYD